MKNFSQNGEQEAILNYFGDFKGAFLSVGENDGETLSNVRALALLGWKGTMIEPAPTAFRKLKQLYEGSKKGCFYLHELALGNHNGSSTLHDSGTLLNTGDTSLVSTLIEEEKKRFQSTVKYEPIIVKTFRWKTFINRSSIKTFNFISIDAEAMDVAILSQMDLYKLETNLLCVEWNSNENTKREILAYTSKFGIGKIIYTSAENLIICKN